MVLDTPRKPRCLAAAGRLARALTVPLLLGAISATDPVLAGRSPDCTTWSDELAMSADGLTVGTIHVRPGNLFDPRRDGQDRLVHTLANALHIRTREATVRAALTIASEDPFSLAALAEAERALRAKRYLRESRVVPTRRCGERVDVDVATVDNWTLTPSLSFGSAGGVSRYGVELQDLNLLGLGKELTVRLKEAGDTRETTLEYRDDNVFGGQHRTALAFADTESGRGHAVEVGLPFYAAAVPLSWWLSSRGESETFETGVAPDASSAADPTAPRATNASARVGTTHSEARVTRQWTRADGVRHRAGLGVRRERQRTTLPDGADIDSHDLDERYPFASLGWLRPDWTERRHYLGLGDREDIDLGASVALEAGLLVAALGNARDELRLALTASRGWQLDRRSMHRVGVELSGYPGRRDESGYVGALRYQYFRWLTERDQLDLQLAFDAQRGRTRAADLRLGGEYGLKGYPNAYTRGESRAIGLLEIRHVTRWAPFELVRAAFTAFAEVGRVGTHGDGVDVGVRAADTLADVGLGMTFAPTRSSRSATFRLDLAMPLVGGDDIDAFQVFAGTQIRY